MKSFSYLVVAAIIFGTVLTSCNEDYNTPKEFTVTFETGDDGNTIVRQKVKEGEKITKPEIDPTRCGYTFAAWYKEVEWTNEWEFDSDKVAADMTLYAKWIEEENDDEVEVDKDDEIEDNDETGIASIRNKFLVDKIYNYDDILVAEYFYNNDNKLIKKAVTSNLGNKKQEWAAYSDEFEYIDGRVSKIIRMPSAATHVFYNSQKQLIKSEGVYSYPDFRYKDGVVVGFLSKNDGSFFYTDTIVYNNLGNVTQHIFISPELSMIGQPIAGTSKRVVRFYEYDNNPKPNFGLDYLFIYDPLPFHEEAPLERCLSNNNMTEFIGGTTWTYTYNENGLPSTIEVKWKNVETIDPETGKPFPMLLKIKYKQID